MDSLMSLLDRTDQATGGDVELIGHWGRYLCVLMAGFLENALVEVYSEYARGAASPEVAAFATGRLGRITNPNAGRFVETARSFRKQWADELSDFLDEDAQQRRHAIDSIMNSRNQIAHGERGQISVGRVREYLPRCVEVIEFIEDQLR